MKVKYAIQMPNGSWYTSHGKWNGSGCFNTEDSLFPSNTYETKDEASAAIDEIIRDFPNHGVDASIIELKFSMREVFADSSERTKRCEGVAA